MSCPANGASLMVACAGGAQDEIVLVFRLLFSSVDVHSSKSVFHIATTTDVSFVHGGEMIEAPSVRGNVDGSARRLEPSEAAVRFYLPTAGRGIQAALLLQLTRCCLHI